MSRYRIGCAGWAYDEWRGSLYPPGAPPGEYLRRYARAFDLAEVDASFHQAPTREAAERWARETPPGFLFAPKLPRRITHDMRLRGSEDAALAFLQALAPLRAAGKLGPVVAAFPPTFTRDQDAAALDAFLAWWPRDEPLAVELRHRSWWVPATFRALEARGASLVWSVTEHGRAPPVPTAGWLYARLIGDRALTRFDRIQRDLTDEMRYWRDRFEDEGASAERVFVVLNNHFMGHAPTTAALLCGILGVPPPDLSRALRPEGQSALF